MLISSVIPSSVDALEYTKFMLCAMKKIDADLFDDLQFRFKQLDKTGDGRLTKEDLMSMLK
jgi:Ca2+-binding EF-hand superfamily protein